MYWTKYSTEGLSIYKCNTLKRACGQWLMAMHQNKEFIKVQKHHSAPNILTNSNNLLALKILNLTTL
jgi:hypothetical protein